MSNPLSSFFDHKELLKENPELGLPGAQLLHLQGRTPQQFCRVSTLGMSEVFHRTALPAFTDTNLQNPDQDLREFQLERVLGNDLTKVKNSAVWLILP